MASSNTLRIVPAQSQPKHHIASTFSAPSAPGVHDKLRASSASTQELSPSATQNPLQPKKQSAHPLETRLSSWPQTQQNLNYTLLKRNYGISAPLIREMELGIVRSGDSVRPVDLTMGPGMGLGSVNGGWGRSVHEDVLLGKDWEVEGWGDVFMGGAVDHWAPLEDFHTTMERRLGMEW